MPITSITSPPMVAKRVASKGALKAIGAPKAVGGASASAALADGGASGAPAAGEGGTRAPALDCPI